MRMREEQVLWASCRIRGRSGEEFCGLSGQLLLRGSQPLLARLLKRSQIEAAGATVL